MIPTAFEKIEIAHLESLVANAVSERRTMEYKSALPGDGDDSRREFLADVSSLANASGGDIIYGIEEGRDDDGKPTGVPVRIVGLPRTNVDSEILRLTSIARDCIQPRIGGIQMRGVPVTAAGPVIVVRVPRSWSSPHMVTYKHGSRFYTRSSVGKYPMDVGEIRSSFALSESLAEKVQAFRDKRVARVASGETLLPLRPGARLLLQLLPIGALDRGGLAIDVTRLEDRHLLLLPIASSSIWSQRYNIDGFLTCAGDLSKRSDLSYLQVFRSGAIEAVDTRILNDEHRPKSIASVYFEDQLIAATRRYFKLLSGLEVPPPAFLMITLIGVRGYEMAVAPGFDRGAPVDRDTLLLPEVIVEDFNATAERILRPIFDVLWQSVGLPGSPNFDVDGRWKPGT